MDGGEIKAFWLGAAATLSLELAGGYAAVRLLRAQARLWLNGRKAPPMFGLTRLQLALVTLVPLALLLVGAVTYGHGQGVKAERKRMDPWAVAVCDAVGAPFKATDAKGRERPRRTWGKACQAQAGELAQFRAAVLAATAKARAGHLAEQDQKTRADASAAARDAGAISKAKRNMEAANAAVQKDRVGGDWFARLNDLGGLRKPGEPARANRPRRDAEGQPPF